VTQELPEVKVLRLQPGDCIIARFDVRISVEDAVEVKWRLEERFSGHDVLVCSGFQLEVAREDAREDGG
jgi:hypothetical protein